MYLYSLEAMRLSGKAVENMVGGDCCKLTSRQSLIINAMDLLTGYRSSRDKLFDCIGSKWVLCLLTLQPVALSGLYPFVFKLVDERPFPYCTSPTINIAWSSCSLHMVDTTTEPMSHGFQSSCPR
jgi:hypothetical protein